MNKVARCVTKAFVRPICVFFTNITKIATVVINF